MYNLTEIYSNSEIESKSLAIVKAYLGQYVPLETFYYHLVFTTEGNAEKVIFLETSKTDFKQLKSKIRLEDKLKKYYPLRTIERDAYMITTHGYENFNYENFINPLPGFEIITSSTNGFLLWKNQIQILIMQVLQCNEAQAKQWIKDYNKKVPAVREAMHTQFFHGQTLHEIIEKYNPSPSKFFLDAPLEQAELLRPKPFKWPNSNGNLPERMQELSKEIDRLNKMIEELKNNNNGNQE